MSFKQLFKQSILTQIVLLISLFLFSIVGLKVGHSLLQIRVNYLSGLLENEQNRVQISHVLEKKILSTNLRLHDLANVNSLAEMTRILESQAQLRKEISGILTVIEKGGVITDYYPVNVANKDAVFGLFPYVNYSHERINLQVIEFRAKMAELDQIVANFRALIVKKINVNESQNPVLVAEMIRKVSHFYKGIEPFFGRILENSNRIYFDSQQEQKRIQQVNADFRKTFTTMEHASSLCVTLLIIFAGTLIYRSSRKILLERDQFQQELQGANDNLELAVEKRTCELRNEISERKRGQQHIADQAEFLLNTIEALSHPFYVINADNYEIALANSAALADKEESSIYCYSLTHNQDTPCATEDHPCPLKIVEQTGKPVVLEHIHHNQQGEKRYVEVHGYPLFDEHGTLTQMIEYTLDITEKKEAEKALKNVNDDLEEKVKERTRALEEQVAQRKHAQQELFNRERYFRRLIENISDIITIIDQQGIILYASPSVSKTLGMSPEAIIGKDIRSMSHQDDLKRVSIHDLFEIYHSTPMVHRVMTAEGEYKIMESIIHKFNQDDGTDAYSLNSRDVTLRTQIEEEAHKLQLIVEQSPSSIVMTDIKGNIEYVNPAFEEVTGYRADEVLGENPNLLKSGKTPEHHYVKLWETITAGQIWQGEFINKKKNGDFYEENVLVVPIRNLDGVITDFCAVKENITELRRARKLAENANKAKTNFLSSMSHELRTPLNAINGFSQLMLRSKKNPLNEKQKEMTQQISTAGNHLLQLINEVLDLARVESGEFSLSLESISMMQIITESLSLIEPLAEAKSIAITNLTPVDMPNIKADLTRVKQVMLNLMSNAVKYNNVGGTVNITAEADTTEFLRFVVEDTGIGIPPGKQKDLFTPFARLVDAPDEIEGTGIGMTITKQLIEKMGGEIGFSSQEGVGSRFWFTLPVADPKPISAAPSDVIANCSPVTAVPAGESVIHQILYIDDSPVNIALMQDVFTNWDGFVLQTATTEEEGMAKALESVPDLILLDLNLSGVNGFKIFRMLKGTTATEFVPIIAVSADVMESVLKRVKKIGFNGHLTKPVDVHQLKMMVCNILQGER